MRRKEDLERRKQGQTNNKAKCNMYIILFMYNNPLLQCVRDKYTCTLYWVLTASGVKKTAAQRGVQFGSKSTEAANKL